MLIVPGLGPGVDGTSQPLARRRLETACGWAGSSAWPQWPGLPVSSLGETKRVEGWGQCQASATQGLPISAGRCPHLLTQPWITVTPAPDSTWFQGQPNCKGHVHLLRLLPVQHTLTHSSSHPTRPSSLRPSLAQGPSVLGGSALCPTVAQLQSL